MQQSTLTTSTRASRIGQTANFNDSHYLLMPMLYLATAPCNPHELKTCCSEAALPRSLIMTPLATCKATCLPCVMLDRIMSAASGHMGMCAFN